MRATMLTNVAALATIVILLVWMGFFALSSLPLLVLNHDTPLDARFIRRWFEVYYKVLIVASAIGILGQAVAARIVPTLAMMVVCALAFFSKRHILSGMDRLRETMTPTDVEGIRRFRQLHIAGMASNVVQLIIICIGLPWVLGGGR